MREFLFPLTHSDSFSVILIRLCTGYSSLVCFATAEKFRFLVLKSIPFMVLFYQEVYFILKPPPHFSFQMLLGGWYLIISLRLQVTKCRLFAVVKLVFCLDVMGARKQNLVDGDSPRNINTIVSVFIKKK